MRKYVRDAAARRASHARTAPAGRSHLGMEGEREKREKRKRGKGTGDRRREEGEARQDLMNFFGYGMTHCSRSMQRILRETSPARPAWSAPALPFASQIWFKWRQKGQDAVGNGKGGREGAKGRRLSEH